MGPEINHNRPSRKERLRGKRPDRYTEIVRLATRVLASEGYTATNVNQIAALAKVGVGTLYNYFDDKDDLFLTCVETAAATDFQRKSERVDLSAPALEVLRSVIRVDLELMDIDPDGQQLLRSIFYGLNSRLPTVSMAQQLYTGSIDIVEQALNKGEQEGVIDTGGEARLVALMFNGMMETFHVLGAFLDEPGSGDRRPAVERAFGVLCRGILSERGRRR